MSISNHRSSGILLYPMLRRPSLRQTLFEEIDLSLSAFGENNKQNSINALEQNEIKYSPDKLDFVETLDILEGLFASYSEVMFNRIYMNICSKLDLQPDRKTELSPKEKILQLLNPII